MELPLRIALLVVTLIYIYIVLKAVKYKRMQISFSIFWLLTGLILIIALIFPGLVQNISAWVGFGLTVNMVFFVAIFLSFYLIFNLNIMLSKENRKNTLLIQEISLLKKEVQDLKHNNTNERNEKN